MNALILMISTLVLTNPHADPPQPPSQPHSQVAVGVGRPPAHGSPTQRRLMAQRAAEVAAVRQLARQSGGPNGYVFRGFRYVSTQTLSDGRVIVKVERWPPNSAASPRTHSGRFVSRHTPQPATLSNPAAVEEQPIP